MNQKKNRCNSYHFASLQHLCLSNGTQAFHAQKTKFVEYSLYNVRELKKSSYCRFHKIDKNLTNAITEPMIT